MQELLPILQQNPQNQATAVYVLVAIGLIISTITVINLTFKKVEDESKPYYFIAALISIILFGASILMANKIDNDVKKAFENKEYTLTKKDKFLNFDSKSEYLKSKKFLIHFEDDSTIQIEDEGHYYEIDKTKEKVVE
jgi:hypothetical protein